MQLGNRQSESRGAYWVVCKSRVLGAGYDRKQAVKTKRRQAAQAKGKP